MNQTIVTCLRQAAGEDKVAVEFRDGRTVEGAILFNESKGCGKVINIKEEISVDFHVEQILTVKI